jgi:hypothetical protein
VETDMKFPVFLTTALIVAAGAVQAQSPGYPAGNPMPNPPMANQAQYGGGMGGCGHTATIKDEYGFRYDSEGNRLNAQGCVIAPPVTPPGAAAR